MITRMSYGANKTAQKKQLHRKGTARTSSSKKPDKSREDAIPISWKALIWVGFSCPASSICFRKKKSPVSLTNTTGKYFYISHSPYKTSIPLSLGELNQDLHLHHHRKEQQECSPSETTRALWFPLCSSSSLDLVQEFYEEDPVQQVKATLGFGYLPWKSRPTKQLSTIRITWKFWFVISYSAKYWTVCLETNLLIKDNKIPVIKRKVSNEHYIENYSTRPDIWQGAIITSVLQNLEKIWYQISTFHTNE